MKTYLVTGANKGIGKELCRKLKQQGNTVIAVCRSSNQELEGLGVRVESGVDISNMDDLKRLTEKLQGVTIDVLINNAGIWKNESLDDMNFDTILEQFQVNTLGTLKVTSCLLPLLTSGSKVAVVTSRMGSIEDNTSGGRYGYRMSKAALNSAAKSLSVDLKEKQIAVGILHPGMVQTDMTSHRGIPVEESVSGLLQRIEELNLENTGTFWHANGEILPW
ncbi:MAG: SDR family oxidoreductase [Spirochaetota bacterium]